MANQLALMDLIHRTSYDRHLDDRVNTYLIKLAEKMGIERDVIQDALDNEDMYAIFVP